MSAKAIIGARILADGQWLENHALVIEDHMIAASVPQTELSSSMPVERVNGGVLLPGFIDTQVNGGGGILFNDHPTVDGVQAIAAAHRKYGTTAMLPTLISDDREVIARAISAVDGAIKAGVPGIAGIHIEGPFLNPAKHGIHDSSKFGKLDESAIDLLTSLTSGKTLVTLAPECAAPGMIAALTKRGVIVAAGHSLARYEDIERAVSEGMSGVTHLFNAMTQLGSREPGLVGAAIDFGLASGLIVDGYHVHAATMRAAFRAKGSTELMLVTDAMPSVGQTNKGFALGKTWISADSGALRGPDGTLAGSDLDMASALRNAVSMLKIDLISASQMASGTPANFLGIAHERGMLVPGMRADIVHLDDTMFVDTTWINGAMLQNE